MTRTLTAAACALLLALAACSTESADDEFERIGDQIEDAGEGAEDRSDDGEFDDVSEAIRDGG